MKSKFTIQFSPTRLKQMKKIAFSGSRAKLKILNGKLEEGFQILKSTAQKFKSFATDLADRIPQALAAKVSLDLFSHFENKSSKRLGIPKGIVLGGVLALMASLPAVGQTTNAANTAELITQINAANLDISSGTIHLAQGTIYLLTGTNLPIVTGTDVGGTLQIICTGTTNAIIDGNNANRPITMDPNSDLTLSKITVQNGFVAAGSGGGILNEGGALTISDCLITNNQAGGAFPQGRGAGIFSRGTGGTASVLIQSSTISLNSASSDGGGILSTVNSPVTISSSFILDNTSGNRGGAILNQTDSPLTITNSTISGNTSSDQGGGIWNQANSPIIITSSTISGNTSGGNGGGVFNRTDSPLTISNSSISNNTTTVVGGGIFNQLTSPLIISSSSISGNRSNGKGAGVWHNDSPVTIQASSITTNQSGGVGAGVIIFAPAGGGQNARIENTTISGNTSTANAGGGIYHDNSSGGANGITLQHVTLSDNTGVGTGGFANVGAADITLQNSIIANSSGADFDQGTATINAASTSNIVEDGTLVDASVTAVDPLLDPLTLSTGFLVHPLQAASPALDAADAAAATTNDQLGELRVVSHDMGAVQSSFIACPIDVTSTADSGLGTLRQAIIDANASPTDCVIYLDGGETYTIASNLPIVTGTDVGGTLSIISTGTLNAVIDGAGAFRPLTMVRNSDLTLSKITVQNGFVANGKGGGIYNNQGDLTISDCLITNNRVTGGSPNGRGAGIFSIGDNVNAASASLLIQNSTISLNSASRQAGGIYNRYESLLTISNSSISGNSAINIGGGIANRDAPNLTISNTSILGNTSNTGGGILNGDADNLNISSSSISGNTANNLGGGIFNSNSDMAIQASSITLNPATNEGGGIHIASDGSDAVNIVNTTISSNESSAAGGGIYAKSSGGGNTLTLQHVTISNNSGTVTGGFANDAASDLDITIQNSILANSTGADFDQGTATINAASTSNIVEDGALVDASVTAVDPLLDPLTLSTGFLVHPLQAASPALDAADAAAATTNDQLGELRVVSHDMGAVQSSFIACPIDVTSTADSGLGTLRQAIIDANASPTDCVIYLDGGETYTIASNLPIVTGTDVGGTLSIISTGTLNAVIDGAISFRPLTMDTNSNLTLSKITVQNGSSTSNGGGIYNDRGDLTIANCIITQNRVVGTSINARGGGVAVFSGTLTITSSVLTQNEAPGAVGTGRGGAINSHFSITLIENSTISLNSATQFAGAILSSGVGSLTITSSSFSQNTSAGTGGAIDSRDSGSTITIMNSAFTGNISGGAGGAINSSQSVTTITSSSFSGNESLTNGGALSINNSTTTIQASSIVNNESAGAGGGIFSGNAGGRTVTLENSTVSGNTSTGDVGGGIRHGGGGSISLKHVTLSDNTGNGAAGTGDGFHKQGNCTVIFQNTIVANSSGTGGNDFAASVPTTLDGTSTNNIVENGLTHASVSAVDPLLDPLTLSSGFLVHPLQTGSPAISAGTDIGIATDQLGDIRATCFPDIGAIESSGIVTVVASAPAGVTNTWIGCTNSDWNTANNWSAGTVPTASDVVYVPTLAVNQLIIDEVATCAKMVVQIGAKCLVNYNAGGKLLIKF